MGNTVHNAVLTVKDETFNLLWDNMAGEFITTKRNKVTLADDGSQVSVDMNGRTVTYQSFDLVINYDLHYANQSQIVKVENDGTLGEVSLYLPLGKYNIQEIATPYGFLINDQVQTVNLTRRRALSLTRTRHLQTGRTRPCRSGTARDLAGSSED